MKIPILLVFFNRKDSILTLIKSLQSIQPAVLYLACDGARNAAESLIVEEIRQLVITEINWDCKVETRFLNDNLGCKLAVHGAVQWFFESVEQGIVLEDDCIPSAAFFKYAEHMLSVYRKDHRIASIAGRREVSDTLPKKITFSSKFFCWGWASWSDRIVSNNIEFGYQKNLAESCTKNLPYLEKQHVKGIHNLMIHEIVNSWAYSYDLIFRDRGQLHIIPPCNYIHNIGIGVGTHTTAGKKIDIESYDRFNEKHVSTNFQPVRDEIYMHNYFKEKYSFIKSLLFPYIGFLKLMKKKF